MAATSTLRAQDEDFRIYSDSPRIFLNAQRLRRIQRETQRDSIRWRQFSMLIDGNAQFPEPGFAYALHYAATAKAESARTAVAWALKSPGASPDDLRQLALVFDWCRKSLSGDEKAALVAKLRKAVTGATGTSTVDQVRSQFLAAVAIAEDAPSDSERVVRSVVLDWWRKGIAPQLIAGKPALRREEIPALFEIMHVLQDNTKIDLREDARPFFKDLPGWHLLSHYPAPLQSPENEYRVPIFTGGGEPDLKTAAMSRVAELMMVAYDVNAAESQFMQGYLIQDRFLLRSGYGIPYEFLWANPYQPGLPFEKMAPFYHDALAGRFFVRSSWEEDAQWFGYFGGIMQVFSNGEVKTLKPESFTKPVEVGSVTILLGKEGMQFRVDVEDGAHYFLLGLPPKTAYDIEVDDEEMYEATSDASGILSLDFAPGTKAMVWLHRPGAIAPR
jgi:hypothetical protein